MTAWRFQYILTLLLLGSACSAQIVSPQDITRTNRIGYSISVAHLSDHNLYNEKMDEMHVLFPSIAKDQPGYSSGETDLKIGRPSFVNINLGIHYVPMRFATVSVFTSVVSSQNTSHFGMSLSAQRPITSYEHDDSLASGFCRYDSSQHYYAVVDWTGKMHTMGAEFSLHSAANRAFEFGVSGFARYHWLRNSTATETITETIIAQHHYWMWEFTGNWWNPVVYVDLGGRTTHVQEVSRSTRITNPKWRYKNFGAGVYAQCNIKLERVIVSTFVKLNVGNYRMIPDHGIETPRRQNQSLEVGLIFRPGKSI